MIKSTSRAVESLRKEQREQRREDKKPGSSLEKQLDRALRDTFPASDPVSPESPITTGAPERRRA